MSESRPGQQTIEFEQASPSVDSIAEAEPSFARLSEHSLPIDQADKHKAIRAMTASGLFKPFGRVEAPGRDIADAIIGDSGPAVPIHEVAPHNPDAMLLDLRVNNQSSNGQAGEIGAGEDGALAGLLHKALPEITEALPLDFADRDQADELVGLLAGGSDSPLGDYISIPVSEMERTARAISTSSASLDRLVSAHNSKLYFAADPVEATRQMLATAGSAFELEDQTGQPIKCSANYVKAALESLGVAGVIGETNPANPAGANVIRLFDPNQVDKKGIIEAEKRAVVAQMESTGQALKPQL